MTEKCPECWCLFSFLPLRVPGVGLVCTACGWEEDDMYRSTEIGKEASDERVV